MNKKITLEIITGLSMPDSKKFSLFNFKIKKIENITDRQRIIFLKDKDNQTGNISEIDFLMIEIKNKLLEVLK